MNPNKSWANVGGYQYGYAYPPTPPMSPPSRPPAQAQNPYAGQAQNPASQQAANPNPLGAGNIPSVLMPNPSTGGFSSLNQPNLSPENGWTSISPYQRHSWITVTDLPANMGQSSSSLTSYQAPPSQAASSSSSNKATKHWECEFCDTRRNENDGLLWCHKCRTYTKTLWCEGP
ncbi:hypothetical protein I204_01693 [Kwoniella mangroviensis CBS 8886]|uniref:uncharacterized protein n=1 Tax=Kwoniella mangroviensis CBS 8507 TaxID=1296122 RepID=UPI00080D3CF7|nr:uncharacterized protein I203_04004 [Kwoniella mangroviensis CBS 8507]OCF67314.1 hypothetical protein I203_04004 [Kwoniella mangroviensis CBS 8507]OCF77695.1 hypothetical protein I204_01693 [Kwoniella mangroviensis CBS 8886]